MEAEKCSLDDTLIICSPEGKRLKLSECSDGSESKSSSAENDLAGVYFDNFQSENTQTKLSPDKKGINLLPNVDDSFDVFLPLKKSSSQISNGSKKSAKNKQKLKLKTRTRSCPYFSSKNIKDHFKSPVKSQEDRDLELAIQLSLKEVSGSNSECQVDASASTTSSNNKVSKIENPLKLQNWTNKKDTKKKVKTILSRRTSHDRQQIITQKIAIVLLETKEAILTNSEKCLELCSSVLEGILDKNSSLWELSKINAETDKFYVEALSKFIEPAVPPSRDSDMPLEVKTSQVYQEAGSSNYDPSMKSFKVEDHQTDSNSVDEILSNLPVIEKLPARLGSLSLLSNNWGQLIGNEELSDLRINYSTGSFPCHKLVLFVRCPRILEDVMQDPPNTIDLSVYSFESIRLFLAYIYSGKTVGVSSLSHSHTKDLLALSDKYSLTDLHNSIISDDYYNDSIYSQSTECATSTSPHADCLINPSTSSNIKNNSSVRKFSTNEITICLTDSSSDSTATQRSQELPLVPKQEMKLPESPMKHEFSSRNTESPDLFECNAQSDISLHSEADYSSRSSQTKRKLDFNEVHNDIKKNCPNEVEDFQRIPDPEEIVTIDSDSNERLPQYDNIKIESPHQNYSKMKESTLVNLKSDPPCHSEQENIYENNFHFNFDMNNSEIAIKVKSNKFECSLRPKPHSTPLSGIQSKLPSPANKNINENRSSFYKYLQTSFPSFSLDDSLPDVKCSSPEPLKQSTPKPAPLQLQSEKAATTPTQEDIIIKEATPNTSYSDMATPELKNELSKYGLKQNLGRKKSKALLKYIREQIQIPDIPTKGESSNSTESKDCPNSHRRSPRLKNKSDEEHYSDFEETEIRSQAWSTDVYLSDLSSCIGNFVMTNSELYSRVLLYQTVSFTNFYKTLKDHGINCSINELKDVLNNLCILYRLEPSSRRRKTNKRKPKK